MDQQEGFRALVRREGAAHRRDFAWRRTSDPYAIWISEVMLQQTQTARVEARWEAWLERFPNVKALAAAPTAVVLQEWQGMGYNRRALALKGAAEQMVLQHGGTVPQGRADLLALPGIGPATAQGIRSFAFNLPGVYLETNVRTVFLQQFFPQQEDVPDSDLIPLVEATCPRASTGAFEDVGDSRLYAEPQDEADTPRAWYYDLLDYGAHLKRILPNPSRRSRSYQRQGAFEGSNRQKRAEVVRLLLNAGSEPRDGMTLPDVVAALNAVEQAAGRPAVEAPRVQELLDALEREGFCAQREGRWRIV